MIGAKGLAAYFNAAESMVSYLVNIALPEAVHSKRKEIPPMEPNEAKELLAFHSSRHSDVHNPKWEHGFLGSLRPFRGELHEENFIEVMECLRALAEELSAAAINRELVSDIVAIIHLSRVWAAPDGMLGSNCLLTEEQTKLLLAWADIIETCFVYLLDEMEEEAFSEYEAYLEVHCG